MSIMIPELCGVSKGFQVEWLLPVIGTVKPKSDRVVFIKLSKDYIVCRKTAILLIFSNRIMKVQILDTSMKNKCFKLPRSRDT